MEYESTPFLPPPFTPFYHFYMLVKYLRYRNYCKLYRRITLFRCLCCIDRENSNKKETSTNKQQNNKNEKPFALFDFSLSKLIFI